jgi:flagellin-like hook-associated protein FlgL
MADDLSTYAVATSISVNLDGVITKLDNAIKGVAQARADFGAVVNTLEHSIDNLNNAIQNTSSAKSSIMDAGLRHSRQRLSLQEHRSLHKLQRLCCLKLTNSSSQF